ncbi:MAG: rubredoxin-like domain-containing protein [Nitrospinota bacterium]
MKLWKCLACGYIWESFTHPDVCPQCGATKEFIVPHGDTEKGEKIGETPLHTGRKGPPG